MSYTNRSPKSTEAENPPQEPFHHQTQHSDIGSEQPNERTNPDGSPRTSNTITEPKKSPSHDRWEGIIIVPSSVSPEEAPIRHLLSSSPPPPPLLLACSSSSFSLYIHITTPVFRVQGYQPHEKPPSQMPNPLSPHFRTRVISYHQRATTRILILRIT